MTIEHLTIGQLAASAGVGRETIRYYQRQGLLEGPPRSAAGYRQYPVPVVDRLRFIRRAQELGFTLAEIAELLTLRVDETSACSTVEVKAREKLMTVEQKIADLRGIGDALASLVEKCEAREATGDCPILVALEG
ncbi:MAG: MerR family DNA-binding protein [Gemmatimonadales bacterium]|jgi:MerR family mercuric resistance operon transcriptional regulator|nr:MerR family DNA-binding protein [Gemmatimonadales bacterium]MBT3774184.1 MerR family DNA-binding protein [Gemmatimonadales bacterium]MBT4435977.1 MerR family DNA-binding protein [Gemmatimonadales bacterium]MBT4913910.1 MerR family DNA-binding protein [Gemmatimonadales bacterium]MBT5046742.1 MerR family DNA-binding protein [Gemmatimonadales bacterium]